MFWFIDSGSGELGGRLKHNFPTLWLLPLRVYIRAIDVVVLFVDWKWAKTSYFPA
jgi:hypothetical protein